MRSGSGCWGWQWLTWSVLIAPCASSSSLSSRVSSAHGVAKKVQRKKKLLQFGNRIFKSSNLETLVGIDW